MLFDNDEKRARKLIDTLRSITGKSGTDVFIHLEDDILKVKVWEFGKKLLGTKINLEKITEMTHDEVSYVLLNAIK